jgi:hypothetical protein
MAHGNRNTRTNEEEALLEELAASEVSRFIMPGKAGDSTYQGQHAQADEPRPQRRSIATDKPAEVPPAQPAPAEPPRPSMTRQVQSVYQAEPAEKTPAASEPAEPPVPAETYQAESVEEQAPPAEPAVDEPAEESFQPEAQADEAGPSLAEYLFEEADDEPMDPREKLDLVWDKDTPRQKNPEIEARKAAAAREIAELLSMSKSTAAQAAGVADNPAKPDIQSIMGEVLDPHELNSPTDDEPGELHEPHENVSPSSRSLAEEILNQRMAAEAVADQAAPAPRPASPSTSARPAKRAARPGRGKNVLVQVLIILMAMLATGLLVWLFL